MSTYLYLMCMDHTPPLEAAFESGQHTYDLPQIRADIANRDTLVAAWEASGHELVAGGYFQGNTLRFLAAHPRCNLGIRDEYDRWHSITDEAEPRCGSSVTLRDEEHRLCRCHLPDRHGGYHDSGDGVTWTGR